MISLKSVISPAVSSETFLQVSVHQLKKKKKRMNKGSLLPDF